MKRLLNSPWPIALSLMTILVACGGDENSGDTDGGADDGLPEIGFATPTEVTTAYRDLDPGWEVVGAANWSCLGTPSTETMNAVDVNLTGEVQDFQSNDPIPDAEITLFGDDGITSTALSTATADQDGKYALVLPAGQTLWAFKLVTDNALDTYTLNEYFDDAQTAQTAIIDSVSESTAQALPAFIGVTRTPGLGIVSGSIRDCDGNRVKGAIVTVSSTVDEVTPVMGSVGYYFSALSTSLPVRHSQQSFTNDDGVFVVIELPEGQERFLQIWGFVDAADMADGSMTLLGQVATPIVADAVVKVTTRPLRQ